MVTSEVLAETSAPAPAGGLANPTLAFNPSGVSDWGTNMPFIDLMDTARTWIGHLPNKWGGMSAAELQEGGFLDENGWVKKIPEGVTRVGTIWDWGSNPDAVADRKGVYVLTYEGEGTINPGLDARIISSEPGRIVFENMGGRSLTMDITSTDPNGTGDYIRDISIVAEEDQALHEAGAIFNPDWLALIDDARVLRFMDWGATNNSTVTAGDMPLLEAEGFWPAEEQGVPVEYMVALANETGADPWFCIPHGADAAYIRAYATYVRDHLDPGLTAHVEYSNEVWNWSFQQPHWLAAQALAEWGVGDAPGYHVKKAVETALIWQEVFGSEADARLENVLATQTVNTWLTQQLLSGGRWRSMEPDAWVDPTTVFDQLAVTTYFGGAETSNATLRAELLARIQDPDGDAAAWLAERLMDPEHPYSIPQIGDYLQAQADLAHRYGLDLVAYEGGQHVHHSFAVQGLTEAELAVLTTFMAEFVRSDEMAMLYNELWQVWAEVGDGPFMQFGDVGASSRWGSWGLYNSLGDENPRAALLEMLNRNSLPWWEDAEGGAHYQQGVILEGTAGADLLTGTDRIDYLIGGAGDDILIAGTGDDGLNGGEGTDRLVLSGNRADYRLAVEGAGYRLTGPDGSKFVIHIESFTFDDGQVTIEDLLAGLPPEDRDLDVPLPDPANVRSRGACLDAEDLDNVRIVSQTGVIIGGVNVWSTLGRELGLTAADASGSYVVNTRGAQAMFGDQAVTASYWSLQDNRADQGGPLLGESALETALRLASVVTHAREITATAYGDTFLGREWADTVHGGAGSDFLGGGAGNDLLHGDAGNDQVLGGSGDDTLTGGEGDDTLTAGTGEDVLDGGDGTDRAVLGGSMADYRLVAEDGAYRLTGPDGAKVIAGIELFSFDDGRMTLEELLEASQPRPPAGPLELVVPGVRADAEGEGVHAVSETGIVINGIGLSSALGQQLGLAASDSSGSYVFYVAGTEASFGDLSVGASYWSLQENRAERAGALLGPDALSTALLLGSVATHAGEITATGHADHFLGRGFADMVHGAEGNDYLSGGGGNDLLHGDGGRDRLLGGNGADRLIGGTENDYLEGGAGRDTFVFSAGCGRDVVADFTSVDVLELSDFLPDGRSLADAARLNGAGTLVLSNGTDILVFRGLDLGDLDLLV
ncbi:calcium-binding protein [Rhodobacter sp. CZR27]|uniref:calcium-binding protein n=1 Tax=Rhodobacter sp. CZR27 TaxID=2033869 RepID=UPI001E48B6AD|nr:calcium-binding protein [Rhodobacter sp. CZR27]